MTKKDYEVVAYAMNWNEPKKTWLSKHQQWRNDCKELAVHLKKASKYTTNGNKSFKTEQFLEKCGMTKEDIHNGEKGINLY